MKKRETSPVELPPEARVILENTVKAQQKVASRLAELEKEGGPFKIGREKMLLMGARQMVSKAHQVSCPECRTPNARLVSLGE